MKFYNVKKSSDWKSWSAKKGDVIPEAELNLPKEVITHLLAEKAIELEEKDEKETPAPVSE